MELPKPRDFSQVPAYIPGKSEERVKAEYGLETVIKLSSNENPMGPSPKALLAVQHHLSSAFRYPDHTSTALRECLAAYHDLPADHFLISAGLEEMINCIGRAYILEGQQAVMPEVSFIKYVISARLMDSPPQFVPMKDFGIDLDGMLKAVDDRTKIIWIANPNNPTGTYLSETQLKEFLSHIPPRILVVLDEAYCEFADAPDYPQNSHRYFEEYPNVLVLRTFSKAFGLATFRIGYAIGIPELLEPILKVREIFSVSSLSETAACAALQDTEFLEHYRQLVLTEKKRYYHELDRMAPLGISYVETQGNFIYITLPEESQKVFQGLQKRGVIVRPAGKYGIRVTIGIPEENDAFFAALEEAIREMRSAP